MKTRHGATPLPPDTYYDLGLSREGNMSPIYV